MRKPLHLVPLGIVLWLAGPVLCAAELAVGPGQLFARIEEAMARARPGDVILVRPQAGNALLSRI